MISVRSPNVKYVDESLFGDFFRSIISVKTHIHENDICEFEVESTDNFHLIENVKTAFKKYESLNLVYKVDTSGLPELENSDLVGSERFCTHSETIATFVDKIIKHSFAFPYYYQDEFNTTFKYVGASSYLRFMRYSGGGQHFPHYDSDFAYPDDRITKYSFVFYFTDNEDGEIAFVNDSRKNHGNSDWDRQADDSEIFLKIKPSAIKLVVFPHTQCHTVLPLTDGQRIVCRGDLIHECI